MGMTCYTQIRAEEHHLNRIYPNWSGLCWACLLYLETSLKNSMQGLFLFACAPEAWLILSLEYLRSVDPWSSKDQCRGGGGFDRKVPTTFAHLPSPELNPLYACDLVQQSDFPHCCKIVNRPLSFSVVNPPQDENKPALLQTQLSVWICLFSPCIDLECFSWVWLQGPSPRWHWPVCLWGPVKSCTPAAGAGKCPHPSSLCRGCLWWAPRSSCRSSVFATHF